MSTTFDNPQLPTQRLHRRIGRITLPVLATASFTVTLILLALVTAFCLTMSDNIYHVIIVLRLVLLAMTGVTALLYNDVLSWDHEEAAQ